MENKRAGNCFETDFEGGKRLQHAGIFKLFLFGMERIEIS